MSGTISGGKKAAQKNKELHGKDFYKEIGRKGGKRSTTGGFASQKVGKDGPRTCQTSRCKRWTQKQAPFGNYSKT